MIRLLNIVSSANIQRLRIYFGIVCIDNIGVSVMINIGILAKKQYRHSLTPLCRQTFVDVCEEHVTMRVFKVAMHAFGSIIENHKSLTTVSIWPLTHPMPIWQIPQIVYHSIHLKWISNWGPKLRKLLLVGRMRTRVLSFNLCDDPDAGSLLKFPWCCPILEI